MNKYQKIIVVLLITQLILAIITFSKSGLNSGEFLSSMFLILGWSMFSGIFAFSLNKKNIFDFVGKFIFFLISALLIVLLLFVNFSGVTQIEDWEQMGWLFVLFPFYLGLPAFVVGIVSGTVVFFIKKRLNKNK